MNLRKLVKDLARSFGFEMVRIRTDIHDLADVPVQFLETYEKVRPYTMTSAERVFSLCQAAKYVCGNKIEGDIVECGVWKGGSMMAVAETFKHAGDVNRELYLFDTFEGMPPPTEHDVDFSGDTARNLLTNADAEKDESVWCRASLDSVKKALASTGYPAGKIHFVKGLVEQTIPECAPEKISLLRLDTDWYESTKHEMQYLFPRLTRGGVLIIDDYGHWKGARTAVDEYLEKNRIRILLNRIDYTGRIAVKID